MSNRIELDEICIEWSWTFSWDPSWRRICPIRGGSWAPVRVPCPFGCGNGVDHRSAAAVPPPGPVAWSAAILADPPRPPSWSRPAMQQHVPVGSAGSQTSREKSWKWREKGSLRIVMDRTALRMAEESTVVLVVDVDGPEDPSKWRRSGGRMAARLSLSAWSSDFT